MIASHGNVGAGRAKVSGGFPGQIGLRSEYPFVGTRGSVDFTYNDRQDMGRISTAQVGGAVWSMWCVGSVG